MRATKEKSAPIREPRALKNEIRYKITLDEDQKKVKESIYSSEIIVITGYAGSGKSLVTAQSILDLVFKKEAYQVYVTRSAVEVGKSLGFLPGELDAKFDPYIEAFRDNLYKCYDKDKVDKHIKDGQIQGLPVQYIRGKTVDNGQVLVVEEAQNLTKHEMLAILTRLGKGGKIIINGDNEQSDIKDSYTGLHYVMDLAKAIPEIKWHKLKSNHRSELISKILDFEHKK
jgi:phosphate starvation-inducible PhoH-like protein